MGKLRNKIESRMKIPIILNSIRVNILDYILVYLLIANSGIPFFYPYIEFKVINFIIVLLAFLFRRKTLDKFLLIYLLFFLVMVLGQFFIFNIFAYKDYLTIIVRIFIAYFTIKTVLIKFFKIYVNIIYFFAVVSFFFYIPSIIIPGFVDFIVKISPYFNPPFNDILKNAYHQVILFSFPPVIDVYRNSGPFWEMGTFGGFLNISIIINTVMKGVLFEKKNLVMIAALLTTLSTTNYIALFLFITVYFVFIEKKINSLIITLPLLVIFITVFIKADFLQNKVISQVNEVNKYYKAGKVGNRFVSAIVDLKGFLEHPIFGIGRGEIREKTYSRFEEHRSNGLATYLADFGIIFFLFYFSNMYLSFFRFCRLYEQHRFLSYVALIILMLIGFSEEYYNFPFFYALTMLHLAIPSNMKAYLKHNILKIFNKVSPIGQF